MSILDTLNVPIIAAPMAGGPSTPELVSAAHRAGGFGFLAAGYLTPEALEQQMRSVDGQFGVNLFYPQAPLEDTSALAAYASKVRPLFDAHNLTQPDYLAVDPTDSFAEKLELVLRLRPAVVSCTFGLFTSEEVQRLHDAGIEVWMTVASPEDAAEAETRGADAIVVQGPEAGGHRSTRTVGEIPDQRPLGELIAATSVRIPIIAAGGITTAGTIAEALSWPGVRAVSCGSAFLLADEAGTNDLQRAAVEKLAEGQTAVTRAFSGRCARGVETQFMRDNTDAPAAYPHVNTLMGPLRKQSGEPNYVASWAGTQAHHAISAPTGVIYAELWNRG